MAGENIDDEHFWRRWRLRCRLEGRVTQTFPSKTFLVVRAALDSAMSDEMTAVQ